MEMSRGGNKNSLPEVPTSIPYVSEGGIVTTVPPQRPSGKGGPTCRTGSLQPRLVVGSWRRLGVVPSVGGKEDPRMPFGLRAPGVTGVSCREDDTEENAAAVVNKNRRASTVGEQKPDHTKRRGRNRSPVGCTVVLGVCDFIQRLDYRIHSNYRCQ